LSNSFAARIKKLLGRNEQVVQLTPEEMLRIKMWRARASHSRAVGVALLAVSGVFLALAFVTQFTAFEMVSLASFVMGVFLIAVELEPRIKLFPSAVSLMGPMLALADDLDAQSLTGKASYVPIALTGSKVSVVMRVTSDTDPTEKRSMVPVGHSLADYLEGEIGPLEDAGPSYVSTWLPKALEKGLGMATSANLKVNSARAEATFQRPYIRALCANEEFNRKVCGTLGCPMVGSVGEILALATGKKVQYQGCRYDRVKETSDASYEFVSDA
jgi:hypothetical protein